MSRKAVLAKYLECTKAELTKEKWDKRCYSLGRSRGYLVLTDEEANERAAEYIKESLWAFNASFLSSYTGVDEVVFEQLSELYEDANDAILSLIEANGGLAGLDGFIEDAICADGRGHFLNTWDGSEHKIETEEETYYIYRV